jgi:hypothetical protein
LEASGFFRRRLDECLGRSSQSRCGEETVQPTNKVSAKNAKDTNDDRICGEGEVRDVARWEGSVLTVRGFFDDGLVMLTRKEDDPSRCSFMVRVI